MKSKLAGVFMLVFIAVMFASTVYSEPLTGNIGSSPKWGSGWIDLLSITQFQQGDRIRVRIGGTAKKVVVRFLPKGADPNDSSGIDGGVVTIPDSRVIDVVLKESHNNVRQISVHGGENPWGLYFLGGGNGPATLLSGERLPKK